MIRLPPSTITLGPIDLYEYDKGRAHRISLEATENVQQELSQFEISAEVGPSLGRSRKGSIRGSEPTAQHRNPAILCRSLETTNQDPQTPKMLEPSDEAEEVEAHASRSLAPSPENVTVELPSSSPSRDDFHYGGFLEGRKSRSPSVLDGPGPDDASTPKQLPARLLPRSPLYYSQNASPDHPFTMSLTPRVGSRVMALSTPGLLFSQPPRRSARFRHQTNSFSFDESSDRASAVYQQDRITSGSTIEASLHEELRGSSLHSTSSQSPKQDETIPVEDSYTSNREFIFSSPLLSLPPPFSARSRSSSKTETLPVQSPSATPHQDRTTRAARPHSPRTPSHAYQVYDDSQTPESQPQTPAHLPEARHQSRFHSSYTAPVTRASARARSRVNSINYGDGTSESAVPVLYTNTTPSRRAAGRSGSPIGLLGAGVRGLYGGRENGDDEQNWNDGVRASNV